MNKRYVNTAHSQQTTRQFIKNTRQQGVVLIVALVFLVALTGVAVALMQNTSSDVRMSGASEEKVIATQQAISANDEVISDQISGATGTNGFAFPLVRFPLTNLQANLTPAIQPNTVALVDVVNNDLKLEGDCPHSRRASSTSVFSCNMLRTQIVKTYGRPNSSGVQTNTIIVNSGVAQELLK
ncbi:MAG: pilus assembly PilX family protein [Thalassotalea sp.]|mgnify:FL=1